MTANQTQITTVSDTVESQSYDLGNPLLQQPLEIPTLQNALVWIEKQHDAVDQSDIDRSQQVLRQSGNARHARVEESRHTSARRGDDA
ncbi:hypothetical protein WCQ02_38825 [Paraburkholderia tropica]|uniref:hypothetical protein n=1 Tax=Paraburkholderia tropica TaxID=92647 RepID=UPI0030180547